MPRSAAGFNEARPNWAGKYDGTGRRNFRAYRFNEARPNWAGKSQCIPLIRRPECASMRPGPIGPGN